MSNQQESDSEVPFRFSATSKDDRGSQPLQLEVNEIKESKWTLWAMWGLAILLIIGLYASSFSFLKNLLQIHIGIQIFGYTIPVAIPIWLAFRYKQVRQAIEIAMAQRKKTKVISHSEIVSDKIRIEVNP